MTTLLTLTNEDPIDFTGTLDSAGALQLVYGSQSLADHQQTLEVEHEDYNQSGGTVRVKLLDFSDQSTTWTVAASHQRGGVNWTRDGDHAYYEIPLVTGLLEVDVIATDGAARPQQKARKIWIKTTPADPLPDGP